MLFVKLNETRIPNSLTLKVNYVRFGVEKTTKLLIIAHVSVVVWDIVRYYIFIHVHGQIASFNVVA